MTSFRWKLAYLMHILLETSRDALVANVLMYAAVSNATDVARLLIEAGADVNARDNGGKTVLMWAAQKNAKDVMALLKAAGAKE